MAVSISAIEIDSDGTYLQIILIQEEVKWGNPCYTYQGANIVLIHGFCLLYTSVITFFKRDIMEYQQTANHPDSNSKYI